MTQYLNPPGNFRPAAHNWPYNHGVMTGNLLFIAGQVGLDENLTVARGALEQAELAWQHIATVCEAAGGTVADVVAVTVYLHNIDDAEIEQQVRAKVFDLERAPAATMVQVSRLGYPGLLMEITAIAVVGASTSV